MKKYVKPMITLERFELSQNIAACAWDLNSNDEKTCSATPDDTFFFGSMNGNLFTQTTNGCTVIAGVNYEDYCYQTGSGSPFRVFQS